ATNSHREWYEWCSASAEAMGPRGHEYVPARIAAVLQVVLRVIARDHHAKRWSGPLSHQPRQLRHRSHPLQFPLDVGMQAVLLLHGGDLLPAHFDLRHVVLSDAEIRAEAQIAE